MQESILLFFNQCSSPITTFCANAVSAIAEAILPLLIICFIYWCINKKSGLNVAYNLCISLFINTIIKIVIKHPRPFEVIPEIKPRRLHSATGYSFPSTHTQIMSTFTTNLAMFHKKAWMFIVAFVLILLTALSRVYLGVHWPTDVLGGFILGSVLGICGFVLMKNILSDEVSSKRFAACMVVITVITFSALTIIHYCLPIYEYIKISDNFKITGLLCGISLGNLLEMSFLKFEIAKTVKQRILVMIFGAITTGLLYGIMKLLLPTNVIMCFIRYFAIGFWVVFLYPLIAVKCHWLNPKND